MSRTHHFAAVPPGYTKERDEHLALDLQPSVGAQLKSATCDFWDSLSAW